MESLLGLPAPDETCQWVTEDGHACGATLPTDPKLASVHFRNVHALQGDSKEKITCLWQNCGSHPVQQRNMIRHILSVHLGLLRWTCPQCLKTFARSGVAHNCHPRGGEMLPYA